ncbi:MAG: hypothetical protein WBA51_03315 [Erythrobacter sp.]
MTYAPTLTALKTMGIAGASLASLSGCAGNSVDYPPFTIPTGATEAGADSARVSASFPGVETPEIVDPATTTEPLPTDLEGRINAISARARAASEAFSAGVAPASKLANAAQNAPVTSDTWASAQISLADLTSHHSTARLALADLDLLAATAQTTLADDPAITTIAEAQERIAAALREQDKTLATIAARLDR